MAVRFQNSMCWIRENGPAGLPREQKTRTYRCPAVALSREYGTRIGGDPQKLVFLSRFNCRISSKEVEVGKAEFLRL